MTIRQIEVETVSFVIIAAFISSFFVWRNNQKFQQQFHLAVPIEAENTRTVITSVPNPVLKIDTATQISPDGTRKVVMKTTHNIDGTLDYNISVSDGAGANQNQIYKTTVKGSESMSILFNTWSPDDQYFIIAENAREGQSVFVFKASGALFANGEKYLDVTDLFSKQNTGNNFSEATGWASQTLIIVNTTTKDNTKGPSYWFEVPSKAIIQLSSEF